MTQDTALEMKDVELNELDQEKLPMATGADDVVVVGPGEKNGVVKIKLEDDDDQLGDARAQKFTGLSKEELLKVAGTPGWVRVRWALLILFWVGWLGMLAGAVAIIVQAPRCRPLPILEWWHKGPLYQIGDPTTFQDSNGDGIGDLKGIQDRMEALSTLKVKGLVIGPLHVNELDNVDETRLTEISPSFGTSQEFKELLETARKKSIKVILDLTPNYKGGNVWFDKAVTATAGFQDQMKEAMSFWLSQPIGGIYFRGIENLDNPAELIAEWKNLTSNFSTDGDTKVLLASTDEIQSTTVLRLVNETDVGLFSSRYLLNKNSSGNQSLGDHINQYREVAGEQWISWTIGGPQVGRLASLVQEKLLRAYMLLLFTLPGTPIMRYGDEIGLKDQPDLLSPQQSTYMRWDDTDQGGFSTKQVLAEPDINNVTFSAQETDKGSLLTLYKRLSELRGKERSLLHGDFVSLAGTAQSWAYLRSWDQNERFISALNFDPTGTVDMTLKGEDLPEQGTVVLSSDPQRKEGSSVSLLSLKLSPGEALLLKFPYNG
ncbi:amino acid transporter heavy chain SLC3A2 [Discoglossus pictus]